MVLITTTYRHDYVPPIVSRYKFIKSSDKNKAPPCDALCECAKKIPKKDDKESAAERTNLVAEWTGIAPMGLLIDPRIIPSEATGALSEQSDNTRSRKCMEEHPNRFLTILRTCYPDLYERLNNMPNNELKRRLDIERLKTTYQIDYCHLPEYPEGIYHGLENKDGSSNSQILIKEDGCAQFKDLDKKIKSINPDDCQEVFTPHTEKISSFPPPPKDNTGHHSVDSEFLNHPKLSEYMESISRTGCVITRNRIHSHAKSCKTSCIHKLKHPCKKIV